MHYYEVSPNQIVRAGSAFFTYASEIPLATGQIVSIEVGKKSLVGVVLRETKKPPYDTKPISSIIEETPLPEPLVRLALWMSEYYATHLATVLQTILPRGIQKNRREQKAIPAYAALRERTNNVFTPEQTTAIDTIERMSPGSALLHGVTGSGKTAVYIELATRALARGHSVIVLVPEIALTSQLVDEFSQYFGDIILTHSRQTESQRHIAWREALTAPRHGSLSGHAQRSSFRLKTLALSLSTRLTSQASSKSSHHATPRSAPPVFWHNTTAPKPYWAAPPPPSPTIT